MTICVDVSLKAMEIHEKFPIDHGNSRIRDEFEWQKANCFGHIVNLLYNPLWY